MDPKRKSIISHYRSKLSFVIGLIELCYIAALVAVLAADPTGDCNQPIREWLQVLLAIFAAHFTILSVSELLVPSCGKLCTGVFSVLSAILNTGLGLFMVAWFIIGNYWYYNLDSDCSNVFSSGETLTYVILVIYYVMLGLACCTGCVLLGLTWVGDAITTRAPEHI